jgi:3-hydroxybutyryl-CoA dehydratase
MNAYSWDDLNIGMTETFEACFSEENGATFAVISGDSNPLHVDRTYAVSVGFEAPAVFGMLTSSLYSRLVGVYLPGKFALLEGIDINFHSLCFAGDKLTVKGEIAFLMDAYRRMEIKASIRKANSKLVSKAVIRVGLHA